MCGNLIVCYCQSCQLHRDNDSVTQLLHTQPIINGAKIVHVQANIFICAKSINLPIGRSHEVRKFVN